MTPADLYPALFGPGGRWPSGPADAAANDADPAAIRARLDAKIAAMVARRRAAAAEAGASTEVTHG